MRQNRPMPLNTYDVTWKSECIQRSTWSLLNFITLPRPDDLLDSLEMCQVSSFARGIHHQCEGGGETEGVEEEDSQ